MGRITNGIVFGWACDPNTPEQSIAVHIYIYGPDGEKAGYPIVASWNSEPAVNAACGGGTAHRYEFTIPDWRDRIGHELKVFGIDSGAGGHARLGEPEKIPPPTVIELHPGDSFQQRNDASLAGMIFLVKAGVHVGQRVHDPRAHNTWDAEPGAILDGQQKVSAAFTGWARDVQIRNVELRNYKDNGIHFRGGRSVAVSGVTVRDTGSGDGEINGAIRLDEMTDVSVTDCYMTRTSSGVLVSSTTGPIVIERNVGLNIGRNMVQLAVCSGGGIRVRYNSMERVGDYLRPGAQDVEDWISVFKVDGLASDPAQFSFNRARGHGPSRAGSFVMLGDGGGRHQLAEGNIGVTPGQVGLGLSGGDFIVARDNVMVSAQWADSNVPYYSGDYTKRKLVCSNHVVENNRSNWINRNGGLSTFATNSTCLPLAKAGNTFRDLSLTEAVWDTWSPSP